jgi:ribosome biogenesis GTPase
MYGIVSKSTGSWYKVLIDDQEVDARLRGILRTKELKSTNPVVVGDKVLLEKENDEYFIKDLTERKNCIVRKSNKLSKQYQVIASNLDALFLIVTPSNPFTPQGFIDRFLVTAEAYHIPVVLLINKKDIDKKKVNEYRDYLIDLYSNIGYKVMNVSFLDHDDVAEIHKMTADKTILISGNSGVGKSTLMNALDSSITQKIGEISTSYHKGKHTTTFAQMFCLENGARMIDTPGIKDFGIVDIEQAQVSHYFPEMESVLSNCKFNNCLHIEEPSCAVLKALEEGEINEQRYINYLTILEGIN